MQVVPKVDLKFSRVAFAICPTGSFCREDRCQSFFKFNLIPTMRAPLEECESAGAIRAAGGIAQVFDAPAARMRAEEFLKNLKDFSPDLIIVVITFATLEADLEWASKIKRVFPSTPIGIRGAPCYVMDNEILRRAPQADFCIRGEYEVVFDELLRFGINAASGITYRNGEEVIRPKEFPRIKDLDSLPFPDRNAINQRLYTVRGIGSPQATVRVQRGCPYPCTYCLVHTVSGDKARHRSPKSIASEIKAIQASGINSLYLRAETFTLDKEWALETCQEIAKECPGVKWVTTTRVEKVDEELLGAMKESGCYGISFGIDVTSPEIGKHVRKLADKEISARAMRLCDKHGIISLAYIMMGFLWETKESLQVASDFVHDVRPDLVTIHYAHPYPGTRYFDEFQRSNKKIISTFAQAEPANDSEQITASIVEKYAKRIRRKHYMRPKVLLSLARKVIPLSIPRAL